MTEIPLRRYSRLPAEILRREAPRIDPENGRLNRYLAVWRRRLGSLSWQDCRLLLRITGILLIVSPVLRWFSLPRAMELLDPGLGPASDRLPSPSRIIELTRSVLRRNTAIFHESCLRQSLVLFRLLRQSGQPVVIRFGVAMEGEDIKGHSWLEQSGQPIAEEGDPYRSFAVIYSYPSAADQQ